MYNLVVLAIFKNESHIINEWITHHLNQGVEHFYMIDNGSKDNYRDEIPVGAPVTIVVDPTRNDQNGCYNRNFKDIIKNNSKWVMTIDLDEFVYIKYPYPNIFSYLERLPPKVNKVNLQWKMFGSSGFTKQPKYVTTSFTKRDDIEKTFKKQKNRARDKSIVRSNLVIAFDAHHAKLKGQKIQTDENLAQNEEELNDTILQLNHYPIQSWQFFRDVKMKRGDVKQAYMNNLRDLKYFQKYDTNYLEDKELAEINSVLNK